MEIRPFLPAVRGELVAPGVYLTEIFQYRKKPSFPRRRESSSLKKTPAKQVNFGSSSATRAIFLLDSRLRENDEPLAAVVWRFSGMDSSSINVGSNWKPRFKQQCKRSGSTLI
jgi:hypothetical protein